MVLSERSYMGVRDPIGCERPALLSEKLCMSVRDPRCNPKSSIALEKTHGHVHYLDLELSDRSRD